MLQSLAGQGTDKLPRKVSVCLLVCLNVCEFPHQCSLLMQQTEKVSRRRKWGGPLGPGVKRGGVALTH